VELGLSKVSAALTELTIVGVNEEVRRTMAFRPLVKIDVLIVGTWHRPRSMPEQVVYLFIHQPAVKLSLGLKLWSMR